MVNITFPHLNEFLSNAFVSFFIFSVPYFCFLLTVQRHYQKTFNKFKRNSLFCNEYIPIKSQVDRIYVTLNTTLNTIFFWPYATLNTTSSINLFIFFTAPPPPLPHHQKNWRIYAQLFSSRVEHLKRLL